MTSRAPWLLPGSPRWAIGTALLMAGISLVADLTLGRAGTGATEVVRVLTSTVLYLLLAGVTLWRARRVPDERSVWVRIAIGCVVMSVGGVVTGVLVLVPAAQAVSAVPIAWAPLAAFPFWYGGLTRWNRYSTNLADPNDVLNGASAVLAVMAVLDIVVEGGGSALGALPWWQLQSLFGQVAVGFVLVGTAVSIAFLGATARDPRTWLSVAGFGLPLAGVTVTIVTGGGVVGWAGVAAPVSVVCMVLAAALRPGRAEAQPTDPSASTVGAFVVIVAAIVILVCSAVLDIPGAATWCAALAAAGSSTRMLVNVSELSLLAVSRKEALTDELTGLANRRAVLRRVEELADDGAPFVLALLDLDKFKEVNDGLGHAAGDDLLRAVARRLEAVLRPGDVLGRLGGDEFAVVTALDVEASGTAVARRLGERLRDRLAEPFPLGGLLVHAGVSIGLTADDASDPGRSRATELLRRADAAMYDAKRSGAEIVVFDPAKHADSSGHLALVEELRAGMVTGQLELHHQPQLDVATGRTVGVEALVRWRHPVRGLLGPGEFLPLAEVHGLMGALTEEVLGQAVAQLADWRRRGLDLRMSVNLSATNLLDTGLPDRVAALLRRHAVPAGSLVLEVTESVLLSDPERSLAVIGALKDLGTTVSIDDFGTGYSSLTYLRELPVAELKLDRSFTADLLTDPRTEAIVASTIELAHRLGLRVVAEGVEQVATETHLRLLGCDETQGYLHARPLPADRFEEWLATRPALVG